MAVAVVKEAILRFLKQNPRACDTVEGIALFWVPDSTRHELLKALSDLVEDGRVQRVEVGQQVHYCLPPVNE